ncbi:MAG: glycosyltransferase family 4 protein, partial [Anaerolineales bacterium]|nr:glycosyltransferase family 4 protein [Anaerolineales bacterium]
PQLPAKVLMLGPALSDQGGMASVEHVYLAAWDAARYELRHIGTYNSNFATRAKVLMAIKAIARYLYLLLFWRPDVIHIHFAAGVSFYRKSLFVLLGRFSRARLLMHSHAPNFDTFFEKRPPRQQRYIRHILNSADCLLVVSNQWQARFEAMGLTVPVVTIYNPVARPAALAPASRDKPLVLSLGRLGERKGTYDILKAVPLVLAAGAAADFWLGGDGEVEQVREIVSANDWGQHVRLLGWVRDQAKHEALSQAAVFLLPSYFEGLPVAVLEAMAYGIPVVSTPVGGIPEAVDDGETGFLVPPGDVQALAEKIRLLLDDPALRARMSHTAQQRMQEKFEVTAIMRQLYALYDELTEQR